MRVTLSRPKAFRRTLFVIALGCFAFALAVYNVYVTHSSQIALHRRKKTIQVSAHCLVDRSIPEHQVRFLEAIGVASLEDRFAAMCHLSAGVFAVPIAAPDIVQLRSVFPHRVCAADLDVFFTASRTVMVGHPQTVAQTLARARSVGGDAVESIVREIEAGTITDAELMHADAQHRVATPLAAIARVVALGVQEQRRGGVDANFTRVTLEVKVSPQKASSAVDLRGAFQAVATVIARVQTAHGDPALHRHFGLIVDPHRFPLYTATLLGRSPAAAAAALLTEPPVRYLLAMKDVLLDELEEGSRGGIPSAAVLCEMLLLPPPWALEVMPSVTLMERCLRNYSWVESSHLSGERELHLVSLNRAPHGAMGWRRASKLVGKIDGLRKSQLCVFGVNVMSEYRSAKYLSQQGLREKCIVSDRAQTMRSLLR
jgi:hypothetical protein